MQSSTPSRHFLALKSKYFPQLLSYEVNQLVNKLVNQQINWKTEMQYPCLLYYVKLNDSHFLGVSPFITIVTHAQRSYNKY
jgi:hypothetical protein